ncbi:MAG: 16S rRNA (cytidine(1402)-2'-O)-methyltransferase, partial [Erysipelotrichaceae bacterium]|nr:16S rRNA (cytidine(1402)-2'-O)-methyltransferase [Erysipelotrichaceae bacterium]
MIRKKHFEKRQPTLYLVATPIGNQQEITQRALDILNEVDVIAAEDTRHSGQLLKGYGISKPFLSHHEHNQSVSIPKILHHLEQGDSVALISDAGYPVISDPGNQLVQSVIQQGFAVVPVSGANAGINALVASGLDASHYLFYGFLNAKSSKRKKELESLKECPYTLIFYEAPHRIQETLKDMLDVLSDRHMCLARELTKMHEEMIYGTVSEVLDVCEELKGEMV